MRKIILITLFFLLTLVPNAFAADENFAISVNSAYQVKENGTTTLTQNISIQNKSEYIYTPSYTISVGFKNIEDIESFGVDGAIPFTLTDNPDETKNIKLTFPKRFTGLGTVNSFTLRFNTTDVAKKQGNVWEVSIPGISNADDFSSYNTVVTVPSSFGPAKIIKPNKQGGGTSVRFSKDEIGRAGVFLIFGEKQYYTYDLKYHIVNPNLFPVKTELALPPKTPYQNVLLNSLNPSPLNVTVDKDGNWLAEYRLLPQQRQTVTAKGVIEILPESTSMNLPDESIYLAPQKYWDSENVQIRKLAEELKSPEKIYEFVVNSLTYNFEKVTKDNKRLGGTGTLKTPDNSVCLEFTDLFVSLARAAGIPARANEGFAYTQNDKLRPLSLVDDVLHAWPEYYDRKSRRWVMIDPTWGNTTKGMDYFKTLDFEHITFVVKGVDSEYPIPAGGYKFENKSKDVAIQFSTADNFSINENLLITDSFPSFSFPGLPIEGEFIISNKGNIPIENETATIAASFAKTREFYIDFLPPHGYKRIKVKYDNLSFLTNKDNRIKMQLGTFGHETVVSVSFIPDLKYLLIIGGILGGSSIIALITYRTGSILVLRRKRKNIVRGQGKRP